jgi:hypothetical protein
VSPLKPDQAPEQAADGEFTTGLKSARLGLPHATCFGAYLFFEGRTLATDTLVTLVNRCFRNESNYAGLRRLLSFQMREIVALGSSRYTHQVLEDFTDRIHRFSGALGLDLAFEAASDPFYERGGSRDVLQRLSPVKHEFQYGDLAIASVNIHRNFFGERCNITFAPQSLTDTDNSNGANGSASSYAFTSCVAFGLERWLAALTELHDGSVPEALRAVQAAAAQVS